MKSSVPLLFTVIFITLLGCSKQSSKNPGKYTDYDHGYYFFWKENRQLDSAFFMFSRYVKNPDDTLNKAMAYRYMGDIQWNMGDLFGAQQSLTSAISTLDTSNDEHRKELGIVYNLLGNVSLDLGTYDDALGFFDSAITVSRGTNYVLEILNGKAVTFQKMGNYNDAIAVYDSMLILKPVDQEFVARIIDNRAKTKWMQDSSYFALPEFQAAIKIRIDSNNNQGLNTSYAHLSDYYAKSNHDSALWYANKMYEKATENRNPNDVLEATYKMIRLNKSSASKQFWFEEFKKLNDSLQLSKDTSRNRFALVKYDFRKSNKDNDELKKHITTQRLIMYGLIILAIVSISGISFWFGKRKKRIKQESEIAIRDSKLKTSQKVHDVIANGLYGIMNELEHGKDLEREPLITKIEELYEDSRNISYEDFPHAGKNDYYRKIHELFSGFTSEQVDVFVVGNEQTFWDILSDIQKYELYMILKNILINMKKHSEAKNVVVQFRNENNRATILYKDDGIGLGEDKKFGNGLNNTVSRIKSLGGDINFGKSEKGGVLITISFPLQSSNI